MCISARVSELIKRFSDNIESYKSQKYNETQVRQEFINPLFKELGWDIDNESGFAEAYKEVVHEDAIKIAGSSKAPDYSFRIGGVRKFFLEAKKPFINIKNDIHPAYQLRRYAWSAGLSLSILTDFEEFAVYDCRIKPNKNDSASVARIMYFTYEDYPKYWDKLKSIFSKNAILKGSFDRYADDNKNKKGTTEVNDAFLKEIESWRDNLAKNLALRNINLNQRELNFAVQRTIDRILFLRICEDRGIEKYAQLKDVSSKDNIYLKLKNLFLAADRKYNSGIFHFKKDKNNLNPPDELTLELNIDDKILKTIIDKLYYPDSPYEFSVLPADILGQVYEQFLGKIIRLTKAHQAKIEYKPEVKKAGGVYYTPTYIVDYIIKNTVGKLIEKKTPKDIEKIKILDPSCGSGTFLIQAYQYLLDYHLRFYQNKDKYKKLVYIDNKGDLRLTTNEKKRILLNNIFGVDIDNQAVEVTKLSLLLKVLEGETKETLESQLELTFERALPDLEENIKCGNSLISSDFYSSGVIDFEDEELMYRVNVFDWDKEFNGIMKEGGFDIIIGNPPYIRIQTLKEFSPVEVEFFKDKYFSAKGSYDIYVVFIEKGLNQLLKDKGKLGFIVPHKFFNSQFGDGIRKIISDKKALNQIVHFGHLQIFKNATTYTCLLFLSNSNNDDFNFIKVNDLIKWYNENIYDEGLISNKNISNTEWKFVIGKEDSIFKKLSNITIKLGDISNKIYQGLATGLDKVFVLKRLDYNNLNNNILTLYSKSLNKEIQIERDFIKPFLLGKDIKKYKEIIHNNYIVFPYLFENNKTVLMDKEKIKKQYPLAWEYLLENKKILEQREKYRFKDTWWQYSRPQNLMEFDKIKIITPEIALGCQMTLDIEGIYHTTKIYGITFLSEIKENKLYFLALLNSNLLWYFLKSTGYILRGGYFTFKTEYLKPFPIKLIDFSNKSEKAMHDKLVSLVESILLFNKKLSNANSDQEKTVLQRQINAVDNEINQIVYKLYNLDKNEIEIIENS